MPDDLVYEALRKFRSVSRRHRYGGMLSEYRLAEAAVLEYEQRLADQRSRQLSFADVTNGDDTYDT